MSKRLLEYGQVSLTAFCGPAILAPDRTCFQIDGPDSLAGEAAHLNVCLTSKQAEQIALKILKELGYKISSPAGGPNILPPLCGPLEGKAGGR